MPSGHRSGPRRPAQRRQPLQQTADDGPLHAAVRPASHTDRRKQRGTDSRTSQQELQPAARCREARLTHRHKQRGTDSHTSQQESQPAARCREAHLTHRDSRTSQQESQTAARCREAHLTHRDRRTSQQESQPAARCREAHLTHRQTQAKGDRQLHQPARVADRWSSWKADIRVRKISEDTEQRHQITS